MAQDNEPKIAKLLEVARELHEKQAAIFDEIDALLGGKAGIGEKLKQLERAFDALWCQRYAPGQTGRYVWNYTVDRAQMKRLLKSLPLEEIEARMPRYIASEDPFYAKARHPFRVFVSSINAHARQGQTVDLRGFDLELEIRPVGCSHIPPCKTDAGHTRKRMAELRS